jgi:hypothetical protein
MLKPVAALFVEPTGVYSTLDVDMWPLARDGRLYAGPHPVVAHPPCQLWVNMAAVNWNRYGKQRPAWYPGGTDGGCFASALASVRKYGGVLEHPAGSHAWEHCGLMRPNLHLPCWEPYRHPLAQLFGVSALEWVCEVWQSAYGHKARKRTWLLYCGKRPPFELNWAREPGTHQVGWFDRAKPTLSKREACATPEQFAEVLIQLARHSC